MSEIDSRAAVSPRATLGNCVRVGPFAVIGDEVELGDGCVIDAHAVVRGPAKLGKNNHVFSFALVGGDPQDLTYTGQRVTLEVGDSNEFREYSTVNRGTIKGGGVTRVGSHCLLMSYAHVAHDCVIGNNVILINGAQVAGHITVGDYATIGAFCLLHPFCRVGEYAYIAAGTVVMKDIPPFSMVVAPRDAKCFGLNRVGLERHGFSPERIQPIEKAYRYLLRSKLNTTQALEKMRGTLADSEDVLTLIHFIESTERGLTK